MDTTAAIDSCLRSRRKDARDVLRMRYEEIVEMLRAESPEIFDRQRHLDEGTTERVYWHYGYAVALKDVLALLGTSTRRN